MPHSPLCAWRSAALLFAFAASLAAQQDRVIEKVDRSQARALKGNIHPQATAQADAGPVDPSLKLNRVAVLFQRSLEQQTALNQLLREQQTRSSANYHKWLTPAQFGDRFGVSANDVAKVTSWLQSEGLTINEVSHSRNAIWFSGTAGQIQTALRTNLRRYQVNGQPHFANSVEPSVPAAIAPIVKGFLGLNDFHPAPVTTRARRLYTSASGGHSLAPDDFATIYNLGPLYRQGYDGTNQTIAVVGESDINLADIRQFRSRFGLPVNDPLAFLVPGSDDPGINDAELEGDLDVEWAGAVARNATIFYIYSTDVLDSTLFAIENNIAAVISFSFGSCEADVTPFGVLIIQEWAQQANAEGITWLASSGDAGAATCDRHGTTDVLQASNGLAVSFPASIPEVTGLGGTQFNEGSGTYWNSSNSTTFASALSYIPEVGWNESGSSGLLSSGGGLSTVYSQPWWQVAPGVPNGTGRAVPDISLASEVKEGHRVISEGVTWLVGGTSAAAPTFAGVLALVNQYQVANGVETEAGQGNINPNLYSLAQTTPSIFHDITGGNNIVPCVAASPDCGTDGTLGYAAGPGYDLVTGLGTVDVYNLAVNLTTQWNTPAISGLNPSSAFAGAGAFTLAIYGSGFDSNSVVQWMGTALPTTFMSPTYLLASVSGPRVAAVGNPTITVSTSQGTSAAAVFSIKTSLGAQVTTPIVSTTAASGSGCTIPSSATTVSSAHTVYLYFQAIVSTRDYLIADWVQPDGTVVSAGTYTSSPVSGNYCFTGAYLNLSDFGDFIQTGVWHARVFDQGTLLFAIPFTVTLAIKDPFPESGQVLPASGGLQSLNLTFPADYAWTASASATWISFPAIHSGVGNAYLSYQVAPNTGLDRTATITIGDYSFTVEEQAASIPGLVFMGSMPHLAAEENWTTTFTLVNKSTSSATARLSLFGDPTSPLTLPLTFPQQPAALPTLAASLDRTIGSNSSLIVTTAGPQTPPVAVGSAQLSATKSVDGFAIFHLIPGAQEAVVPLETRNAGSYLLAFDHTGGVVLGVAVQNVSPQAGTVAVIIRDDTGMQIGSGAIQLAGSGHTSFVVSTQFPITANLRGILEFDTPAGGQISVLGIRTTPLGSTTTLTTIPALANVGTTGGSIAHLASGNGWQTTFVLINAGSSAAQAQLNFFADVTGAPLSLPISFPQTGSAVSPASSVTQSLAPGATLLVQSTGVLADPLLTGSAQLSTTGNVSGFVIFRYNPNGQEAVVPLESRNANGYILAFDNTAGTATGIAINSVSSQAVDIPVIVRDDQGNQIATDTLNIAANGHLSFTLAVDKYPSTANIRGTIEFDTPSGGQIGALGIRIPVAHTFTTLPALVK
jgi:hypothetical protein